MRPWPSRGVHWATAPPWPAAGWPTICVRARGRAAGRGGRLGGDALCAPRSAAPRKVVVHALLCSAVFAEGKTHALRAPALARPRAAGPGHRTALAVGSRSGAGPVCVVGVLPSLGSAEADTVLVRCADGQQQGRPVARQRIAPAAHPGCRVCGCATGFRFAALPNCQNRASPKSDSLERFGTISMSQNVPTSLSASVDISGVGTP